MCRIRRVKKTGQLRGRRFPAAFFITIFLYCRRKDRAAALR
jgi:hypothetical protein